MRAYRKQNRQNKNKTKSKKKAIKKRCCSVEPLSDFCLAFHLPLGLLAAQEGGHDGHNRGQSLQVRLELFRNNLGAVAQLGKEVLAVRAGAHGGAEDGLNQERVVGLEGDGVGLAERIGKLLSGLAQSSLQSLAGEVKTARKLLATCDVWFWVVREKKDVPEQPHHALGGNVFLLLELVQAQSLQVLRQGGSGQLAITDFLYKRVSLSGYL